VSGAAVVLLVEACSPFTRSGTAWGHQGQPGSQAPSCCCCRCVMPSHMAACAGCCCCCCCCCLAACPATAETYSRSACHVTRALHRVDLSS
jgi:hypothetical protein